MCDVLTPLLATELWQALQIAQVRAQKGGESDKTPDADLSRRAALASLGVGVALSGVPFPRSASASDQPASILSPSSVMTDIVPSTVRKAVPLAATAEGVLSARAGDTVSVGRSGAYHSPGLNFPMAVCSVPHRDTLWHKYDLNIWLGHELF